MPLFCSCTIWNLAHPESSPFQSSPSQILHLFARLQKGKDVCRTSTWKLQVCYISSHYANESAGFSTKSIHQMAPLMPALWFCDLPAKHAGVPFPGSSCWCRLMSQTMVLTRNWHLAADFTKIQHTAVTSQDSYSSDITGSIQQCVCTLQDWLTYEFNTVVHGGGLTNHPPNK